MSLKQYSPEQLKEMAMVEVAYDLLKDNNKQPIPFSELVDRISSLLGLSKEQVAEKIAQFYTDLNIDGRFIILQENNWGLRNWYPYDQMEEEAQPVAKAKKKKSKKAVDDEELEDFDEVEEEDLDFDDDLDVFEEDDALDDDDLVEDDEDEDEDIDEDLEIEDEDYDIEDEEDDEEEVEEDEEEEL
ncbi:DNA-directed RNA polymerase subunit delta [Bacillus lacus]|uniref:Probable DNA-directed RNA polymerase subunit delta n=1 Tax=Metabacillus lacus TaxID=1983721 RepID=A0A7X2IWR6_9BACI|nr:DNA-directed RNA polymerase subunit delta [Metabacillus lacus]MRX71099.1 DNA-directed RNA polymerase subunit delta [Metabacillus lacus]